MRVIAHADANRALGLVRMDAVACQGESASAPARSTSSAAQDDHSAADVAVERLAVRPSTRAASASGAAAPQAQFPSLAVAPVCAIFGRFTAHRYQMRKRSSSVRPTSVTVRPSTPTELP
jgi:hypothetical protein